MRDLRALLELRQAWPVSFSADGSTLLVASDLPGTRQLFTLPAAGGELEQLTDFAEPVEGQYLPGRTDPARDRRGRQRAHAAARARGRPTGRRPALHPPLPRRLSRRVAARVLDEPPQRPRLRRRRAAAGRRTGAELRARRPLRERAALAGRALGRRAAPRRAERRRRPLPARHRDRRGRARDAARGAGRVRDVRLARRLVRLPRRDERGARHARGRPLRPRRPELGGRGRVALGPRLLRRRRGPSPARRGERGRLLAGGAPRPADARAARGGAAARPRRRRALRLLARRVAARVRLLDDGRAAPGPCPRARLGRACAEADRPRPGRGRRRAGAAPLRELRRRVDPGLPVRAGGGGAVPGRRHGPRRARVAVAAVVLAGLRRADAVPRLARLRRRGPERARLDRLRQALRASRRRRAPPRLGARPGGAARVARRRGRRSTARARSSTGARTAAT